MKLAPVLVLVCLSAALAAKKRKTTKKPLRDRYEDESVEDRRDLPGDRYNPCQILHEGPDKGYNIERTLPAPKGKGNGKTCRESDTYAVTSGCAYTIRCMAPKSKDLPGYYFEGDYDGNGVEIKCRPNGKWTTVDGQKPIPKCIQGCLVPSRSAMENSTFKEQPKEIYTTEYGQKLYPAGSVLETRCKDGFVFTDPKFEEKGYDRHVCKNNGGSGWYDELKKDQMGWPAKCSRTCPAYSKTLPDGVEIVQNPETGSSVKDYGNGTIVLLDKAQYKLKCKEGYKPANPKHTNGTQVLNCQGGSWYDVQTGKGDAKPLECLAEGCPDVNKFLPPNAYTEIGENCGSGSAKIDGCKITIKCKQTDGRPNGLGWFMPNKPNGYGLKCAKGTWQNEDGTPAVPGGNGVYGECKAGCVGLTSTDKVSTEITNDYYGAGSANGDIMVYNEGTIVGTTCKDGYIRPGLSVQPTGGEAFRCMPTGWVNTDDNQAAQNVFPNSCSPACELPEDAAGGTVYNYQGTITVKNGRKLLPKGSNLDTQCKDKYVPPAGSPIAQSLVCEGGNNGWKAKATNKTNEVVLRCERDGAAGCTLVQNTTTIETHYVGNCTPTEDNLLPPNCKIIVKCKPGFFPEGPVEVDGGTGEQPLECKAGKDGYVNNISGKTNTNALKCIQACVFHEEIQAALYSKRPEASEFIGTYAGKRYVRPGTKVVTKCKPIETGYYYNNDYDQQRALTGIFDVDYTCKGGNDKYEKDILATPNKMPGDMCGPICDAILPTNTQNVQEVGNGDSIAFWMNSTRRAVNLEYHITCRPGYEFPKGSQEAAQGIQKLLCVGGTAGYMDTTTKANHSKMATCEKSEAPSCPPINLKSSETEISTSYGDCSPSSGKFKQGCEITLKCAEGSFPEEGYQGTTSNQKITCKILANNTAVWTQGNSDGSVAPLKCVKGCEAFKQKPSFIITNSPTPKIVGGVSYYTKGTPVTVRCNLGYVPNFDTDLDASKGEIGIPYVCLATDPNAPWQNTVNHKLDRGPGSVCVKTCPALRKDKLGVEIINGPTERSTDIGSIVSGGGIYTLGCRSGYHYENTNHAANNTQKLMCDPDTGTYIDLTNGNSTDASMVACKPDLGPGCPDLVIKDGSSTSPCKLYEKGCTMTLQCDKGFIPEDKNFHQTGTQQLTCPDGNDWVDANGNKVTSAMKCVRACKYDPSLISSNAHVNDVTTITVKVNNVDYVVGGTTLKVTCKGDGVIWVDNVKETTNTHEYKCIGSGAGYSREGSSKMNLTLGDGCVGTCVARTDLPGDQTLSFRRQPTIISHNGQDLVIGGDGYLFQCVSSEFIYPNYEGTEQFSCNANTRQFQSTSGQKLEKPTSCIRNPNLDECKILPIDGQTVDVRVDECHQNSEYYKSGCTLRLKCKSDHMPVDTKYHTISGMQELNCEVGGKGWKDQYGNIVTEGMKCVYGCVNYTTPPTDNDKLTAQYANVWDSKPVNATCYEARTYLNGTILIESNIYACVPKNPEDYFKKTCIGACRSLIPAMFGEAKVKRIALSLKDRTDYVFANTWYEFTCKEGFEYPPGSQRDNGYQRLMCSELTGNYDDFNSGEKNATVVQCVEKAGCQKLKGGVGVGEPSVQSCSKISDESFRDQCTLEYKCQNGYYPADDEILYKGSQIVKCDASRQSWTDPKNNVVTKPLDCLQGCSQLGYETVADYLRRTGVAITTQPITDSNGGQQQCYIMDSFKEIKKIIQQIQSQNSPYFCKTKDSITNVDGIHDSNNGCPGSCLALKSSVPEGVVVKSKPGTFRALDEDYVAKGDYVFQCDEGYEYEAGTPEAVRKEQHLTCLGNGSFVDSNGIPTTTIKPCRKIVGCGKLVSSPSVTFTPGSKCGNGNVEPAGCEMTAKCPSGTYPTDEDYQKKESVTYKCHIDNLKQPVWVDNETGQRVSMLKCAPGCLPTSSISHGTHNNVVSVNTTDRHLLCTRVEFNVTSTMPNGVKQYYCELKDGADTGNGVFCNNGCIIPRVNPPIIKKPSASGKELTLYFGIANKNKLPESEIEVPNGILILDCPQGQKFQDTQTQQRTLLCSPDSLKFTENGKIVNSVGTCV